MNKIEINVIDQKLKSSQVNCFGWYFNDIFLTTVPYFGKNANNLIFSLIINEKFSKNTKNIAKINGFCVS